MVRWGDVAQAEMADVRLFVQRVGWLRMGDVGFFRLMEWILSGGMNNVLFLVSEWREISCWVGMFCALDIDVVRFSWLGLRRDGMRRDVMEGLGGKESHDMDFFHWERLGFSAHSAKISHSCSINS